MPDDTLLEDSPMITTRPSSLRIVIQRNPLPLMIAVLAASLFFGLLIVRTQVLTPQTRISGPSAVFFYRADLFYLVELGIALTSVAAVLVAALATPRRNWQIPNELAPEVFTVPHNGGSAIGDTLKRSDLKATSAYTPPDKLDSANLPIHVRSTIQRLNIELDALAVRVKLNLIIGILLALVGLSALGYLVEKLPAINPTTGNPWWYLAEFAPKLSFILLIDIFAYFFLNLYKATLGDVKYYQNELTNFESRALALYAAINKSDAATVTLVVLELSKTERNYMTKELTNLDLERLKSERNALVEFVKNLAPIFTRSSAPPQDDH